MNLRKLEIVKFPCQAGKTFDFPDKGIVLVTGDNGVGKSGLAEAAAWAAWGKTLRGTTLPKAHVVLHAAEVEVERFRNGLKWCPPGESRAAYATKTKARDALESIIGEFDLWRRSSVFRSNDLAGFAQATDAERKRLLESLASIDGFDAGLKACREQLRSTVGEVSRLEAERVQLETSLGHERQRIADAKAALQCAGGRELAQVQAEVDAVNACIVQLKHQLDASRAVYQATIAEHGRRCAIQGVAQRNLDATQSGMCGTCGQSLTGDATAQLRVAAQTATTGLEQAAEEMRAAASGLGQLQAQLQGEAARQVSLQVELGHARARESVRVGQRATVAQAKARIQMLGQKMQELQPNLTAAEYEVAVLRACEDVLGLRGARVRVLARLLTALESGANAYLAAMQPPALSIQLRPYTVRKSGAVAGAISLEVHGIGGHKEYRAASGGQQRRVDIACMLALADLAATQRPAGTLWFDEVFDALDPAGVASVVALLTRLSQERAVVVVTHSPRLVQGLPQPALRLRL